MLSNFVWIQCCIIGGGLVLVLFGSLFNVSYVSRDHPTYTMSCYFDRAVLYDDNGRKVCYTRAYGKACLNIMNHINQRSNGCDVLATAAPFVHFGDSLGQYVEKATIMIMALTAFLGMAFILCLLLIRVQRWRNSIFQTMVLCHLAACMFTVVYFFYTRKAMDQLRRTDNDNAGQRISFGEGFVAVMVVPIVCLVHDQFVLDFVPSPSKTK